jgi:hypothetical protein
VSIIRTNRDLYIAVADLTGRYGSGTRKLEEYLRALWEGARRFRERTSLSVDGFFGLLSAAFTRPIPPFDEAWRSRYPEDDTNPLAACLAAKMGRKQQSRGADDVAVPSFDAWESFVLRQIVDLREMAEQGMLEDEQRYFGIDSPRGQRWYNFDPCTFLECAMAGSYGGWQPGDPTGREYVPGPVAVLGDDGKITASDPRDVPEPVASIREVSWDDFQSFLGCGQWYE